MGKWCSRCGKPNDESLEDSKSWCPPCHKLIISEIEKRISSPIGGKSTVAASSCEMHMFFVHLLETEEMLAHLRNEDLEPEPEQPARSKISSTQLTELSPIDCVAARVTNLGAALRNVVAPTPFGPERARKILTDREPYKSIKSTMTVGEIAYVSSILASHPTKDITFFDVVLDIKNGQPPGGPTTPTQEIGHGQPS